MKTVAENKGNYSKVLERLCGITIDEIVVVLEHYNAENVHSWEAAYNIGYLIDWLHGEPGVIGDMLIDLSTFDEGIYCMVGRDSFEMGEVRSVWDEDGGREDEYESVISWDRLPGELGYVLGIWFILLVKMYGEVELRGKIKKAFEIDFSNLID